MKEKYSKVKAGELFTISSGRVSEVVHFLKLHSNKCVNLYTHHIALIKDDELVLVLTNHKLIIRNGNVSY